MTSLYLNSNGVWGNLGRIYEKRGSAEAHLTHYSRTPKKLRESETGRLLNCKDEWVEVEVVASKLVDITKDEVEVMVKELYNEPKKEKP